MTTPSDDRTFAFPRRHSDPVEPHDAPGPTPTPGTRAVDCNPLTALSLRFWLKMLVRIAAISIPLGVVGVPWIVAVPTTTIGCLLVFFTSRAAWSRPERYTTPVLLASAGRAFLYACSGSMLAYLVGDLLQHDGFDAARLAASLIEGLRKSAPVMGLVVVVIVVMMGIVARTRRVRLQKMVALLQVVQERDAAARQLAEARLQLLQGQIQPHFIFNTLAAIQHWVDQADPRAGPLLRELTSFLRRSTELLRQEHTPLAVEVDTVRHYLAIMEARLGDRLHHAIAIDPRAAVQPLPPGLLLTLVENAIEHGISPSLHGGTVRIDARDDGQAWILEVRDDGLGLMPGWREGIGLANCRERLQHLCGPRATLALRAVADDTVATVRIEHEPAR